MENVKKCIERIKELKMTNPDADLNSIIAQLRQEEFSDSVIDETIKVLKDAAQKVQAGESPSQPQGVQAGESSSQPQGVQAGGNEHIDMMLKFAEEVGVGAVLSILQLASQMNEESILAVIQQLKQSEVSDTQAPEVESRKDV